MRLRTWKDLGEEVLESIGVTSTNARFYEFHLDDSQEEFHEVMAKHATDHLDAVSSVLATSDCLGLLLIIFIFASVR